MKNTLYGLATLIFLFSSSSTLAETKIYHWVDEDGKTHYADTATPGTEKIQVSNQNVVTMDNIRQESATEEISSLTQAVEESAITYQASIVSPADDSALRSNDGTINIQVKTTPEKKNSHKLQLFLDGKPLGSPQISSTIRALNIDRGTHQIQVQLLDEQGKTLSQTQVVTVHLQRASI